MVKKEKNITVIAKEVEMQGVINAEGTVDVYGKVAFCDGIAIKCTGSIIVRNTGVIKGSLVANDEIIVQGIVDGDLESNGKVKLLTGATVTGNIRASSMIIEEGVVFNGMIKHMTNRTEEGVEGILCGVSI